jgi:hypothetical protein
MHCNKPTGDAPVKKTAEPNARNILPSIRFVAPIAPNSGSSICRVERSAHKATVVQLLLLLLLLVGEGAATYWCKARQNPRKARIIGPAADGSEES